MVTVAQHLLQWISNKIIVTLKGRDYFKDEKLNSIGAQSMSKNPTIWDPILHFEFWFNFQIEITWMNCRKRKVWNPISCFDIGFKFKWENHTYHYCSIPLKHETILWFILWHLPSLWFVYKAFPLTVTEFDDVASTNITYRERIKNK